jgi:hypothetical protein
MSFGEEHSTKVGTHDCEDGCQGTRNNSCMGKAGPEGVMLFEGTATTRAIASEFPSQRLTKREVLAK